MARQGVPPLQIVGRCFRLIAKKVLFADKQYVQKIIWVGGDI